MDKALVLGCKDCRIESCQGHCFMWAEIQELAKCARFTPSLHGFEVLLGGFCSSVCVSVYESRSLGEVGMQDRTL